MNHGNNKLSNPKPGGLDDFIWRLNAGFGRMMGKKKHGPTPSPETQNSIFFMIILCSCIVLWWCTGFYFLAENEYGIVVINGKVVDVKQGIKIGFTLPYPFGNVEIIDGAPSHTIMIGSNAKNSFIVLDKNLLPVSVTAKFVYQITNPKTFYQNHLQQQYEFDDEILWQVMSRIKNIIATKDITELGAANLTVLSTEISAQVDTALAAYGMSLNKFAIINIHGLDGITDKESSVIVPLKSMDQDQLSDRNFTREVKRDRNLADN